MGDVTPNGPHAVVNFGGTDDVTVRPWARSLVRCPNGVLVAVFNSPTQTQHTKIYTSTDDGQNWSMQEEFSGDRTNPDDKLLNWPVAVDGNNRIATTQKPSLSNTDVRIYSVASDGTLTSDNTYNISGSLDVTSGHTALTATSSNEFWLCVHFSTSTSSDYGFQLRRESPTDSSDPFNQINHQFGQSNDAHYPDVQAGPNDKIHVSYVAQSTGTGAYLRYDPSNDTEDFHEDIGSNVGGETTLVLNELDEPVIHQVGDDKLYHRNAGTWESNSYTSDTPSHGACGSTERSDGGDGDVGAVYEVDASDELRAAYGRLDNNQMGSAVRDEDALFSETSVVDAVTVAYQYHHNGVTSTDEYDCLYATNEEALYYFSAPTPLTMSASAGAPSAAEPSIITQSPVTFSVTNEAPSTSEPAGTVTPGAATVSPTAAAPSAEELAVSVIPGEVVRNLTVEDVDQIERISAVVHASAVIAPGVGEHGAEEPEVVTTPGGVTRSMMVESARTPEPPISVSPHATVSASEAAHGLAAPSVGMAPGGVTAAPAVTALTASEPSPATETPRSLSFGVESVSTSEPVPAVRPGEVTVWAAVEIHGVGEPGTDFIGLSKDGELLHIVSLDGEWSRSRSKSGEWGLSRDLDADWALTRTAGGEWVLARSLEGDTE